MDKDGKQKFGGRWEMHGGVGALALMLALALGVFALRWCLWCVFLLADTHRLRFFRVYLLHAFD